MAFWSKITGTTLNVFRVGYNKLVIDASNLTAQRTLTFPDSNGTDGYALTTDGAGNLSWAPGGGGGSSSITTEEVTGTTYNFAAGDLGKHKRFTNVAGCTATIPSGLGAGWNCLWSRSSAAGELTFAASGTTVRASDGLDSLVASSGTFGAVVSEGSELYQVSGSLGSVVEAGHDQGSATINFGAYPGANEASVAVTGQTSIQTTARIEACIMADDTSVNHSASDHRYAALFIGLSCGTATAGTGFTIYARSTEKLTGSFTVRWRWTN